MASQTENVSLHTFRILKRSVPSLPFAASLLSERTGKSVLFPGLKGLSCQLGTKETGGFYLLMTKKGGDTTSYLFQLCA